MADTQLTQSGAQVQADLNLTENLQDAFSTSSTYAVDDIVIYDSKLYKCTTAVSTAGAWDSSKWAQIHLSDLSAGGGGSQIDGGYNLTLMQDDPEGVNPFSGAHVLGTLNGVYGWHEVDMIFGETYSFTNVSLFYIIASEPEVPGPGGPSWSIGNYIKTFDGNNLTTSNVYNYSQKLLYLVGNSSIYYG